MTYWSAVGPTSSTGLTSVQKSCTRALSQGGPSSGYFPRGFWSPLGRQSYVSYLGKMPPVNAMNRKGPGGKMRAGWPAYVASWPSPALPTVSGWHLQLQPASYEIDQCYLCVSLLWRIKLKTCQAAVRIGW